MVSNEQHPAARYSFPLPLEPGATSSTVPHWPARGSARVRAILSVLALWSRQVCAHREVAVAMKNLRGSVLLFKSSGKWYERVICWTTGGIFVHVEIAVDNEWMIGARFDGIAKHPLPLDPATYVAVDLAPYTTQAGILNGLLWAVQQKGRQYGWSDVVFQAIKFLFPNNPLRWGVEDRWDCADYACRYLIHAGVQLPDSCLDTYTVTPNDLGRVFSILAPRKGRACETVQMKAGKSET